VTGLDGFTARSNGQAVLRVVNTAATCGWCAQAVNVEPDPEAGVNRYVEHAGALSPRDRCSGAGRPVTATPASVQVDQLLGDH
jgi:hypothetical protein